ncbi:MAG: hypothetical protein NTZ79_12430 [Proteobacteria bacterium]|nr:hypothetical protein [Pseudomonadota bacterium]
MPIDDLITRSLRIETCYGSMRPAKVVGLDGRGPRPGGLRNAPLKMLGLAGPLGTRSGVFADVPDIFYGNPNDECVWNAIPAAAPEAIVIALATAQEMALTLTTGYEGEGGKAMNYQSLGDNFDGQGMSFGLIQWNFGQNTLGPLLLKMLNADATAFEASAAAIKTNRLAWQSAFRAVGANDTFNRIQREQAAGQYHPIVVNSVESLRGISPDLLKTIEFRSYAALFDTAVQQNGTVAAAAAIKARVTKEKPTTQIELLKIAVTERARKANDRWVADCMSRRLGLLAGEAVKATEHEITATRNNPGFSLIASYGTANVAGF